MCRQEEGQPGQDDFHDYHPRLCFDHELLPQGRGSVSGLSACTSDGEFDDLPLEESDRAPEQMPIMNWTISP
jgi:hypothetical protein